ncbi:NlpC/P60 family protein [Cytobacillus sp. Hz8]|uniref:C40 family peptidase n=1 Tax=Cytobacillus sp. Hz8 TaxID=3347168 RepID=UPI0035DF7662
MRAKSFLYTASSSVLAAMIMATPVFASPVDSSVSNKQIGTTQEQISNFEMKIEQLDNRISMAMDKSQKLNIHIKEQQGKIAQTKVEIEEAKKDLDAHKKVYAERLRSIQSQGQQPVITYVEFLFSSNNLSEFLTRSTAISEFIQSDIDLLNSLKEKEQALKDSEEKLHNGIENLQKSQSELVSQQKQIEADKQEVTKELANAKTKLKDQQNQLALQQVQQVQQATSAQSSQSQTQVVQKVQQSFVDNSSQSTLSSNVNKQTDLSTANKLIAVAKQYLGVPYVWGGTTPKGFDCSGFTSYVYRSIGISLPRVSSAQQNVGTRISPSQVQPGDLVFMGNPAYHVGIYIGGGQFIHAPHTGDVVRIASYNPSSFSSAARVLH